MYDTFLAAIMICAINADPGVPFADRCVFVQDKTGPAPTRAECRLRIDKMWQRILLDPGFITSTHKKIGKYRLVQRAHRGFCLDPQLPADKEIWKYYEP